MIKTLLVDPDTKSRKRLFEHMDWYRLGYQIHSPELQTFEEVLHAIDKEPLIW